jgi:hypothetical protein
LDSKERLLAFRHWNDLEMSYQESQNSILEAETLVASGDVDGARAKYLEAARLQNIFVDSLPFDKVRTRSVYGLSAATLYYRANDLESAARLAHSLLAHEGLEERAAIALEGLLSRIHHEKLIRNEGQDAAASSALHRHPNGNAIIGELTGTIRAVDLDSRKVRLDTPGGYNINLKVPDSISDDKLGPMLNHTVKVQGYRSPRRKGWVISDIDYCEQMSVG